MQWSCLSIKLHDYSLHPTVGLKATTAGLIPLLIHFWWCSEKREYFKISKISTKKNCKNLPFSLKLQFAAQNLRLQPKQTPIKMFLESSLKYLQICQGKIHNEVILLKNQFYYTESTRF